MTVFAEVTTYEAYRRYAFKTSDPIQAHQRFSFEPVEGGTRLTTIIELADPELTAAAKRQGDKDLVALKALPESRS